MDKTVERWFARLSPKTIRTNKYILTEWLSWMKDNGDKFSNLSPDELVKWQKTHGNDYELLDYVQDFVRQKNVRFSYKQRVYGAIRSFFNHNRASLPSDHSFYLKSEKPKTVGNLTVDELKQIVIASNPLYRTIFLSMFQAGLSVRELLTWSEEGLEDTINQLHKGNRLLKIELPGRKRMRNIRPYYTYIGSDAINALNVWLLMRPTTSVDHIFITQMGNPISYRSLFSYWHGKLEKLRLIKKKGSSVGNRYGKNLHEMRDLFRSRWEKSPASGAAAEFFMGHAVDPLEYNKALRDEDYASLQYLKAEPYLNIMSQNPTVIPVVELEKLKQEQSNSNQKLSEIIASISELHKRLEKLEVK